MPGSLPFHQAVPLEAAVHRIQTRFINIHYVTEQQAAAFVVHGLKDYMGRVVHTDGTVEERCIPVMAHLRPWHICCGKRNRSFGRGRVGGEVNCGSAF